MARLCITNEIGEAVAAARKGEEEYFVEALADICIRVFDLVGAEDLDLERAIREKMERNTSRPSMHGKLA